MLNKQFLQGVRKGDKIFMFSIIFDILISILSIYTAVQSFGRNTFAFWVILSIIDITILTADIVFKIKERNK